jgi:ankyrin repeat protein
MEMIVNNIKQMKCIQVNKYFCFNFVINISSLALMEACMDGHVQVAKLLLDHGADVNMPPDSYESPLTLSACGGHIELASLLIERGANLEEVNDEGYTPLMEGLLDLK